MAKRKKKWRSVPLRAIWFAAVCALIAFSIIIRWWGMRKRPPRGETAFQIEVLNGSGEPGLAMRTAMDLRRAGIDVLVVGDAEHYRFEESILVDRKGNAEIVERLGRLTGCRRIIEQRQSRPLVDVTFIVGRDMAAVKMVD